MMSVALRRDWTNGARIIEAAKTPCDSIHAVRREGLYFSALLASEEIPTGARTVNAGAPSPSGLCTTHGSKTDMMNVTIEKPTSAMDPIRPT
jgi:hypothetical protein